MTNHTFEAESQAITRLANDLARHILPLFAETSGGKPKLVGSSFLISSGINSYLVSAAHVFDELKAGYELFFYIEPLAKRKVSGNLRLTATPEGKNRKGDRFDVGVLKLEGAGLPPYPKVEKYPLAIGGLIPNRMRYHVRASNISSSGSRSRRAAPIQLHAK